MDGGMICLRDRNVATSRKKESQGCLPGQDKPAPSRFFDSHSLVEKTGFDVTGLNMTFTRHTYELIYVLVIVLV